MSSAERRAYVLANIIVWSFVAFLLSGCGGSGTTTLRGTFTDSTNVDFQNQACADQMTGQQVTVKVDNVPAASSPVTWAKNPVVAGRYLIDNSPVLACTGAWEVTVSTAKISYILGVTGLDGVSGTVTVPTQDTGGKIRLDDNSATDAQGNSVIEVAP